MLKSVTNIHINFPFLYRKSISVHTCRSFIFCARAFFDEKELNKAFKWLSLPDVNLKLEQRCNSRKAYNQKKYSILWKKN